MSLPSSTKGAMAAMLLGCSLARAQSTEQLPGFELERLETNTGRGTALVGNGELMVPGGLSVSLLGHYQRAPLVLQNGAGQNLAIVGGRATSVLAASYSVLSWLELGAQVPFVLWQAGGDPTGLGLAPLSGQGLGTPVLQARLGLLSRRQRRSVDLSADLGVGLPIGSGLALAGDSGPRFHARMTLGTALGAWINSSVEAGVLFRPTIPLATTQASVLPGASTEVRLAGALATTGQVLRGELALRATLASQPSLELMGGVRVPLMAGLDAFALGGPGLGSAPGTPLFRVVAGVAFRNEPPPKLSYLDEQSDRELQLTLATPTVEQRVEQAHPTPSWELGVEKSSPQGRLADASASDAPRPPYQPGPEERLLLRGQVHFAQGSSELSGVEPLLDQATLRLAEHANAGIILIEGHADTEGSDASNMLMSLRRAQAARRYLIDQGIPAARIKIRGLGADWKVSPAPATEKERQLNRRAEILVLTPSETPLTTQAPVP
jgi:OmpA-OmpF porin, OOP family